MVLLEVPDSHPAPEGAVGLGSQKSKDEQGPPLKEIVQTDQLADQENLFPAYFGRASPARYIAYTLRFDGSRDEYSATRVSDTLHSSASDSTPTDESWVKRSRTTNLT